MSYSPTLLLLQLPQYPEGQTSSQPSQSIISLEAFRVPQEVFQVSAISTSQGNEEQAQVGRAQTQQTHLVPTCCKAFTLHGSCALADTRECLREQCFGKGEFLFHFCSYSQPPLRSASGDKWRAASAALFSLPSHCFTPRESHRE